MSQVMEHPDTITYLTRRSKHGRYKVIRFSRTAWKTIQDCLGDNRGLYISELMLTTDGGRYPQWIELYNNSDVSIDLSVDGSDADGSGKGDGWRMIVENYNSGDWKSQDRPIYVVVKLKDLFAGSHTIPPRQTVLIVSNKGRNSEGKYFPNL